MAPHERGRRRANGFFAAAGLVLSLMLLRRRFVPAYLLSFVVGFVFGKLPGRHMTFVSRLEAYALPGGPYDPDSSECFHSL